MTEKKHTRGINPSATSLHAAASSSLGQDTQGHPGRQRTKGRPVKSKATVNALGGRRVQGKGAAVQHPGPDQFPLHCGGIIPFSFFQRERRRSPGRRSIAVSGWTRERYAKTAPLGQGGSCLVGVA